MNVLTQQEKDICQKIGVDELDYLATRTQDFQEALNSESRVSDPQAKEKIMRLMGISPKEADEIESEERKRLEATATLTDEEIKICRAMGITPLDYYQQRVAEAQKNN